MPGVAQTYSTSSFSNGINIPLLLEEITESAITATLIGISESGGSVNIFFNINLSAPDSTILDSVVASHLGYTQVIPPGNNLTATTAPTINDDVDLGYPSGSLWVDTSAGVAYISVDGSTGAANWKSLTLRTNYQVTSTTQASTTSTTSILVPGMTVTPVSGTYYVTFISNATPQTSKVDHNISLYSGGSLITHSQRTIYPNGANFSGSRLSVSTQAIVTVNGSQAIEARFSVGVGATLILTNRSLILIRVAD